MDTCLLRRCNFLLRSCSVQQYVRQIFKRSHLARMYYIIIFQQMCFDKFYIHV